MTNVPRPQRRARSRKTAPEIDGSLASLIWPLSEAEFLRDYFGKKPLVVHADPRRLRQIWATLGTDDLETFMRQRGQPVHVWYETPTGQTRRVALPVEHAINFYHLGHMVDPNGHAGLRPMLEQLGAQLRHPVHGDGTGLMGTRAGARTPWHWDAVENFTIQLRGTKRWRLAANTAITQPLDNWMVGDTPRESMASYLHRELPAEAPSGARTVTLRPGSMVYVPIGHWHAVESTTDALSTHFAYKPTTWPASIAQVVRDALEAVPALRRHVPGLSGHDDDALHTSLTEVVARLREIADGLDTDDLTGAPVTAPALATTRFQRRPFTYLRLVSAKRGCRVLVTHGGVQPRTLELAVDRSVRSACLAIAEGRAPFTLAELEAIAGRRARPRLSALVRALLAAGALRVAGAAH